MMGGNGQLSVVPPGFRFHPTDEELLYYYLRKKVSYEPIDLDVIREVDLNKLEPWDLKDKCSIGSGPQNEWYFFSHKDKKYPTGSRTNRATAAGFWKATGRDKVIHHTDSKRIGMRKTLVFYTGRAPHGHKTDWIMHEYRLHDELITADIQQEEGWVICRVFKKKPHTRGQSDAATVALPASGDWPKPNPALLCDAYDHAHLPQLLNPDMVNLSPSSSLILPTVALDNPLRLGSGGAGACCTGQPNGDNWWFLDKLLATHQSTMGGKPGEYYQQVAPPYHGWDLARYPK